jgi:Homeodomain-like domain
MTNEIVNIAQKRNRGGSQAKRRQQAEQMLMLRNRGWTVYDIAQKMGVSEGTVRTVRFRRQSGRSTIPSPKGDHEKQLDGRASSSDRTESRAPKYLGKP